MRLRRRQLLCIIDALQFRLLEASEHSKDVLDFPAEHYREALTWAERNLKGRKEREPCSTGAAATWTGGAPVLTPRGEEVSKAFVEAALRGPLPGEDDEGVTSETRSWLAAIRRAGKEARGDEPFAPRDENGRVHAGFCVDCPTDENGRCLIHPEEGSS